MPRPSTTALLAGVVDYAGLFPPASLSMADAVAEYLRARRGPSAWMLGRFVVPATRLADFAAVLHLQSAAETHAEPWGVSAIVRDGVANDVAVIAEFNGHASSQGARVDSVEAKPLSIDSIDWLADTCGPFGEVYVELAPGPELPAWMARVAARGLRAKIRTGGITADAFPAPAAIVSFIAEAVRHGVVFKATAGLHHAVRGAYRLTYATDAPSAPMYGYLNVLLATAALQAGASVVEAETLLTLADPAALVLRDGTVTWGGHEFTVAQLHATRARLVSFGSCSFREPAEEFDALATR
ncbi:MAG: hypothetical protein U0P30_04745 [Vicinamibacterales bacterium]